MTAQFSELKTEIREHLVRINEKLYGHDTSVESLNNVLEGYPIERLYCIETHAGHAPFVTAVEK